MSDNFLFIHKDINFNFEIYMIVFFQLRQNYVTHETEAILNKMVIWNCRIKVSRPRKREFFFIFQTWSLTYQKYVKNKKINKIS